MLDQTWKPNCVAPASSSVCWKHDWSWGVLTITINWTIQMILVILHIAFLSMFFCRAFMDWCGFFYRVKQAFAQTITLWSVCITCNFDDTPVIFKPPSAKFLSLLQAFRVWCHPQWLMVVMGLLTKSSHSDLIRATNLMPFDLSAWQMPFGWTLESSPSPELFPTTMRAHRCISDLPNLSLFLLILKDDVLQADLCHLPPF